MAKVQYDPQAARELARSLVEPLGRRWAHVQAVASRASALAMALPPEEHDTLITAAWLHDIGYSPRIGHMQFHPLDGARFLRAGGWPAAVVNLVAHHSGARFEAEERGLADDLAEFPFADSALLDALVAADLTTGPGGEPLAYDQRIAEILQRYPEDHPVHRTWIKAGSTIRECVRRTDARIAAQSTTG